MATFTEPKEGTVKHSVAPVTLALVLLVACNPNKSQPPKPKEAKPIPWKMNLQTQPPEPQTNKDVTFRLTMADPQGKAISGAEVNGALVMSLMDMGKNEVKFSDKGNGVYEGVGKLDMAGPWDVVVTAKVAGVEGQKTFPLTVRE